MAKNRKLTAQYEGVTFTRTTARTYTHVVIGRKDLDAVIRQSVAYHRDYARRNWDYTKSVANGTYELMQYVEPERQEKAKELMAMGLDAAIEQAGAEAEANARARHCPDWVVLGWCGRPDLAVKEANTWRNPIHCMADVKIIPVNV